MIKHISEANLRQIAELINGDFETIATTFKEVYDNLESLDNRLNGFGYGTCSTYGSSTDKTVDIAEFSPSVSGIVVIKFINAVIPGSTLNINNTGAKPIYYRGDNSYSGEVAIQDGDTATFVYDGRGYHIISVDRDENTKYDFTYDSENECLIFGSV